MPRQGIEVCRGPFKLETGWIARQASGAVLVSFGETKVLATATRGDAEDLDYFPLIVDYEEKYYAGGKIPGGFIKREGRPTEEAILNARMIDRPIRPLFPDHYLEKVHVVTTVLSADKDHPPEIAAMLGASTALMISPIPFMGPVAGVRVGRLNGQFIINPTAEQREGSDLDIVVAGTKEAVTMVEGAMKDLSEELVLESIGLAHQHIKELVELQEEFIAAVRAQRSIEKLALPEPADTQELTKRLEELIGDRFEALKQAPSKLAREAMIDALKEEVVTKILEERAGALVEGEAKQLEKTLKGLFDELLKKFMRWSILQKKERLDGRRPDELREVTCEVGVLPRVHGSALFTRGETQSLGTVTLGASSLDEQIIDWMLMEGRERFMLHYNFPPYSVGETGRLGPPGRREIGHGHLAKNALKYVIPPEEEFPYIIRVVSEILESNGSSSMATVCSGTLALMDAGVPIKKPVAGIAMGLVEDNQDYVILTDIAGFEDRFGDMDFKVAGTRDGLTAFQMDVKVGGVSERILKEAMAKAKEARLKILDAMQEAIAQPRVTISKYAPVLEMIKIDPEKIGAVIGPGGKTIRKLQRDTGTEVDIDDEKNLVKISGPTKEAVKKAKEIVEGIIEELQIGKLYKGKVVRIERYGAFVELPNGTKGLVHVSDLSDSYVKRVEDVVKLGDEVTVKVTEIDEMGRANLRLVSGRETEKEASKKPIQVGDVFLGKIVGIADYGAFVEIENGIQGLIHISELSGGYVERVEDIVKVGDKVPVQLIRIDTKGPKERYAFRKLAKNSFKFTS